MKEEYKNSIDQKIAGVIWMIIFVVFIWKLDAIVTWGRQHPIQYFFNSVTTFLLGRYAFVLIERK